MLRKLTMKPCPKCDGRCNENQGRGACPDSVTAEFRYFWPLCVIAVVAGILLSAVFPWGFA